MNSSLNDTYVKNLDYHFILNEFGFANWIKAIHDSKSYLTKITFFDDNVTLDNKFQTESEESKVTQIVLRGNNL